MAPRNGDPTTLSLHGIHKNYTRGKQSVGVLKGVSMEVRRGEYVAITGESGSGKSTLLNLLGLLDKPTRGDYCMDGRIVSRLGDSQLAKLRHAEIGFVFQDFHLIPTLSALDNVMLPLRLFLNSSSRMEGRALALLGRLGLKARVDHFPMELSGGECQRVAIARALINQPKILLADEPTGSLDGNSSAEIIKLFSELHDSGQTIILVTHDQKIAKSADRIYIMDDGKLADATSNSDKAT